MRRSFANSSSLRVGGLGALSTRFYTQNYTCDYFTYSCTNVSSNHLIGDVGAAVRFHAHGDCFDGRNFVSTSFIILNRSAVDMPPEPT